MDNLHDFYRTYGERLASRLPGIAHSAEHRAFVFVEEMDNPKEVLEFTSNGKAPAGQPILVWDNFDEDLDTGGRDNYHSQLKCSFSVLLKALDNPGRATAYRVGRAIVLNALAIMIQDAEQGALYAESIQMELRQLPLEKVGPVSAQWYGYGVQFSWMVPINLTLGEADVLALPD
ncbi:hypothetical protein [Spirosoma areae]